MSPPECPGSTASAAAARACRPLACRPGRAAAGCILGLRFASEGASSQTACAPRVQASLYADWVAWLPAEPEEGDARGGEPRARHAALGLRAPLPDALPLRFAWTANQLMCVIVTRARSHAQKCAGVAREPGKLRHRHELTCAAQGPAAR